MALPQPKITPDEFDALTRLDFHTFVERVFAELTPAEDYLENFHVDVIGTELEAVRRGDTLRLLINVAPRSLKTIIVSVAFPAWLWGHEPSAKILHVTYGKELTEDIALQFRQIIQSTWYRRLFPKTKLTEARQAADTLRTTAGGRWLAKSVGGAITGRGANYVIIDDPIKPEDVLSDAERTRINRWYRTTLISRLNNKRTGCIVMVMQRLHVDDPAGHVQNIEPWKVVSLAAIAPTDEVYTIPSAFGSWTHQRKEGEALHPEREPLEILEGLREILGPELFSAQYQQSPVAAGGNIVKLDQLQRYDADNPPAFERTVQSWDTANKSKNRNGYSVCTVWGIYKRRIYLIDVIRERFEFHELRTTALSLAFGKHRNHPRPDAILVEDKASGQSLIQEMKRAGIHPIAVTPVADKITRMNDQTAVIADGCVFIPFQAHWLARYLEELIAFPVGLHNDQVDSTSQALKWFNHDPFEPALLTVIREQWEERFTKKSGDGAENRIMRMRRPIDCPDVCTRTGEPINASRDGLYHVKFSDARVLLNSGLGWTVVDLV